MNDAHSLRDSGPPRVLDLHSNKHTKRAPKSYYYTKRTLISIPGDRIMGQPPHLSGKGRLCRPPGKQRVKAFSEWKSPETELIHDIPCGISYSCVDCGRKIIQHYIQTKSSTLRVKLHKKEPNTPNWKPLFMVLRITI